LFLIICLGGPPVNLAAHKSAPVTEYRRLVYDVIVLIRKHAVIDMKQLSTEYRRLYDITVLIRKHTSYSDWHEAAQYRVQTIGVWHHSTDSKAYSIQWLTWSSSIQSTDVWCMRPKKKKIWFRLVVSWGHGSVGNFFFFFQWQQGMGRKLFRARFSGSKGWVGNYSGLDIKGIVKPKNIKIETTVETKTPTSWMPLS